MVGPFDTFTPAFRNFLLSAIRCDTCDTPTANAENEYGEFVCADCEQNAAERAWDRHQESLMSGDTPTFRETYLAAYEQKRGLR